MRKLNRTPYNELQLVLPFFAVAPGDNAEKLQM
jgi:hypothetical protein